MSIEIIKTEQSNPNFSSLQSWLLKSWREKKGNGFDYFNGEPKALKCKYMNADF